MRIFKNEDAFTGLEAAIVLIAFVVVAAVFSYVVLGAGFFTTQKSQEVVHTGVDQASSSMEIIGNVYGMATTTPTGISYLKFTIGNTAGGAALDVTKMVVSYADESARDPDIGYSASKTDANLKTASASGATHLIWTVMDKINADDDNLLEPGEQFTLGIAVPGASATVNVPITVNMQPAVGAVFQIKRTVNPAIDSVNILY